MHKLSPSQKKLISLSHCPPLCGGLCRGSPPLSAAGISGQLGLPLVLVKFVINELCETGILVEVASPGNDKSAYMPARNPGTITVASVIEAVDGHGISCMGMPAGDESEDLQGILKEFSRVIEGSPANRLLKAIPLHKVS